MIEIQSKQAAVIQAGREGYFFLYVLVFLDAVWRFGKLDFVVSLGQGSLDVLIRPQRCRKRHTDAFDSAQIVPRIVSIKQCLSEFKVYGAVDQQISLKCAPLFIQCRIAVFAVQLAQ